MGKKKQFKFFTDFGETDFTECGNKFSNLARISKYLNVPDAYCLKSNAFKACVPEGSLNIIKEKLALLRSNGGYQLNRIQNEIVAELESMKIDTEVQKELLCVQEKLAPPLIVRSSSPFEDTTNISGAGIYESIGNIKSKEQLFLAIKKCWLSFFSLSALAHRLRIQEYNLKKLPALIIQQFINCSFSGVTFSEDPVSSTGGILVEYSQKGSDSIESGKDPGKRFKAFISRGEVTTSESDLAKEFIHQIVAASEKITSDFKRPMEFEWLIDKNLLYVLQSRPITTLKTNKKDHLPEFYVYKGYDDYEYLSKSDLGDVSEVYSRSVSKRKPVRDLAVKSGIFVHGVTVLQANLDGIDKFDITKVEELNRIGTPVLTIDLGPHIRAFYAKREDVNKVLKTLLQYNAGKATFIVREFASGEFSAISSMLTETIVLIEVCRGSLIGINRGFVETNTYKVDLISKEVELVAAKDFPSRFYGFDEKKQCFAFLNSEKSVPATAVKSEALAEIARFTEIVNKNIGRISLEWSIVNDRPVFIDHTVLTESYSANEIKSWGSDVSYLSEGKIKGEAIVVNDLDRFEYISAGPTLNVSGFVPTMEENIEIVNLLKLTEKNKELVLVSKYPYTAFCFLIGRVKGFVFESGPLLCHFCIVCREQKVPVAIVPNALKLYKDGDKIEL